MDRHSNFRLKGEENREEYTRDPGGGEERTREENSEEGRRSGVL